MSSDKIDKLLEKEEKGLRDAEKEFEAAVAKLQDEYHRLSAEKDAKIEALRSSDLRLLRAIKAAKDKETQGEGGNDEL